MARAKVLKRSAGAKVLAPRVRGPERVPLWYNIVGAVVRDLASKYLSRQSDPFLIHCHSVIEA